MAYLHSSFLDLIVEKLRWMLVMRRVAIFCQLLCIYPGLYFGYLEKQFLPIYLAIVIFLAIFNSFVSRFYSIIRKPNEWVIFFNLLIDLGSLGLFLHFSGGCQNPFFVLIYVNAALGPLFLSPKKSIVFLLATCFCLGSVCLFTDTAVHFGHNHGNAKLVKLAAEIVGVLIIWTLTRFLSSKLQDQQIKIFAMEKHRQKIDNLRAIGAITASFSHELATPLNTIKLKLERIQRRLSTNNQEIISDLQRVEAAAQQCEDALRGLITAATEPSMLKFEKINISNLVKNTCAMWSVAKSDLVICCEDNGESQVLCHAPELALARAFIDLLDNAYEAKEDLQKAIIDINMKQEDRSRIRITISDNGSGIPDCIKDRLGEPFVTTKKSGSGLGIFSTFSIIESIGGSITASNRIEGGTIFTIYLPIEKQVPCEV